MQDILQCYIRTKTPAHLGCDEDYEPASFIVDEASQTLVSFDPFEFFISLDKEERDTFSCICKKGTPDSLLELMQFMKGRTFPGHKVRMSGVVAETYKKNINKNKDITRGLNEMRISRNAFVPMSQLPYIPGSAVKGALRTAWLNKLSRGRPAFSNTASDRDKAKDLEKVLMGYSKFEDDPFRHVKVSDFMPTEYVRTKIVYAVNQKKRISDKDAQGPPQILEVIEPDSLFKGTIRVADESKFDLDVLLSSVGGFYEKEYERERRELDAINIKRPGYEYNGTLLRIGRHCGAESVTIEGCRKIKIKGPKGKPSKTKDKATTIWLASEDKKTAGASPFGWVQIIEDMPPVDELDVFKSDEEKTVSNKPRIEVPERKLVDRLLSDLELINAKDMGRIGTVIQKLEDLELDAEKKRVAVAIREKIGKKTWKKLKRREYLESLINADVQ